MAKFTPSLLSSLTNETSAVAILNSNLNAISTAIENTLSRDGTSPNTMAANLDMNNYRITNLQLAVNASEPPTKAQMESYVAAVVGLVVKTAPTTVSALPSAVTSGVGARGFVTDATATTFASSVTGGGSNKVPVYSDGAVWRIG